MVVRIFAAFIIVGFACSPMVNNQKEKMNNFDTVFIYSNGTPKQITNTNAMQQIVKEATRLFAEADDIYWRALSQSDIKEFREKSCVEIIFAKPKEIVVRAIKESKTISKILIPLDEPMCKDYAHMIYGDPDYKTFNMLLNSEGCDKLKEVINKNFTTD